MKLAESQSRVCRQLASAKPRSTHRRGLHCRCAAAVATKHADLTLHIDQTSVTVPFKPENGRDLDGALQVLLQTFAEKQKAERPKRWKSMEFRLSGDEEGELELVEFFCNPNSAATAFDAKVLITVKSKGGIRLTSEGRLSALKADLDSFLAEQKLK